MTAFHCAVYGAAILAASFFLAELVPAGSAWKKGMREISLYALLFLLTAAMFHVFGILLSLHSFDDSVTQSIRSLEQEIVRLQSVGKSLFQFGFVTQMAILAAIAVLALAGSTSAAVLLGTAYRRYGKISRIVFLVLFLLSSFSFFNRALPRQVAKSSRNSKQRKTRFWS
jgi:hypothetical protein